MNQIAVAIVPCSMTHILGRYSIDVQVGDCFMAKQLGNNLLGIKYQGQLFDASLVNFYLSQRNFTNQL